MYNSQYPMMMGNNNIGNPFMGVASSLPFQQQQQPFNGLIWVKGRESAMQIQLPPNSVSQPILNENGHEFYVVSTDGAGTKTLEVFDYSLHVDTPEPQIDTTNFVSRDELNGLADKVKHIEHLLEAINGTNGTTQTTQSTAITS